MRKEKHSTTKTEGAVGWTATDAVCQAEFTYYLSKWLERTAAALGTLSPQDHQLVDIGIALVSESNPETGVLTNPESCRQDEESGYWG
jgi:hypothetical protein